MSPGFLLSHYHHFESKCISLSRIQFLSGRVKSLFKVEGGIWELLISACHFSFFLCLPCLYPLSLYWSGTILVGYLDLYAAPRLLSVSPRYLNQHIPCAVWVSLVYFTFEGGGVERLLLMRANSGLFISLVSVVTIHSGFSRFRHFKENVKATLDYLCYNWL